MSSQTNVYHTNKTYALLGYWVCFVLFCTTNAFALGEWQKLSPGIEYQDLEGSILTPWSHIYAFRISLKQNKLTLVSAKDLQVNNASTDQFAQFNKGLISINGGFFDQNFKPLGLRINNYTLSNPLKQISWWGVFYVKNNKAYISSARYFTHTKNIEFAIQSGPRLLINGRIPALKTGIADRTALGITAKGKIIFLVSTNAAMTTDELAHLLRSPPLNCSDAINLDGGSSSQIYAHIDSFQINVHGFSNISDAIVVEKRPTKVLSIQ